MERIRMREIELDEQKKQVEELQNQYQQSIEKLESDLHFKEKLIHEQGQDLQQKDYEIKRLEDQIMGFKDLMNHLNHEKEIMVQENQNLSANLDNAHKQIRKIELSHSKVPSQHEEYM